MADLRDDPGPPKAEVRDPDDGYLVALAEAANPVIVTRDDDLLAAGLEPAAITPAQLLVRP
jgi:predicted nucleic acid-binding protein